MHTQRIHHFHVTLHSTKAHLVLYSMSESTKAREMLKAMETGGSLFGFRFAGALQTACHSKGHQGRYEPSTFGLSC